MLPPSCLLLFREELWRRSDDGCQLGVHLRFSDCHETVVGDFQIGLSVLDRLYCSDTDQCPIIEVGRVFLTREFDSYVSAPLEECFPIDMFHVILIEVALVVLRI